MPSNSIFFFVCFNDNLFFCLFYLFCLSWFAKTKGLLLLQMFLLLVVIRPRCILFGSWVTRLIHNEVMSFVKMREIRTRFDQVFSMDMLDFELSTDVFVLRNDDCKPHDVFTWIPHLFELGGSVLANQVKWTVSLVIVALSNYISDFLVVAFCLTFRSVLSNYVFNCDVVRHLPMREPSRLLHENWQYLLVMAFEVSSRRLW